MAILLLGIAALYGGFFLWRTVAVPLVLPTSLPVESAKFLDNNQVFVVMTELHPKAKALVAIAPPLTLACYDRESGEQLWSRVHADGSFISAASVSSDGRWLLKTYLNSPDKVTLDDMKGGYLTQTFVGQNVTWLDSTHFIIERKKSQQFWAIKNNRARLERTTPRFLSVSPDQKLAVLVGHEPRRGNEARLMRRLRFVLEDFYIVSAQEGKRKRLAKLPGDHWKSLSWQKQGQQLWGLVVPSPSLQRADILRYDLASRKTTATRLDISYADILNTLDGMEFKFSPDGRWLAGWKWPNSIMVWDTATGLLAKKFIDSQTISGYEPAREPMFSPDSQLLVRPALEGVQFYNLGDRKAKP